MVAPETPKIYNELTFTPHITSIVAMTCIFFLALFGKLTKLAAGSILVVFITFLIISGVIRILERKNLSVTDKISKEITKCS